VKKQFAELPAWYFDMDEVSAGVYEVIGRDTAGHIVSAKGTDLEALVEQCRQEAQRQEIQRSPNDECS